MKIFLSFPGFLFLAVFSYGAVFTSSDGQFSIDMPAGWAGAAASEPDMVLSVVKGKSRIDFRFQPECGKESCIDQKMADDLTDVKAKKMKVLGNAYTGEDIKKIEFSTGEPFSYINFSSAKADYSAGYFLVNKRAYSVLAQNISYAEADLFFSLISPAAQKTAGGYDTYALPQVEEENLLASVKEFKTAEPSSPVARANPAAKLQDGPAALAAKIRQAVSEHKDFTFVSRSMPSFMRASGRLFDAAVGLCLLYFLFLAACLALKVFVRGRAPEFTVNPASPYPIKFKRLYGTPSLIFRARDNQGTGFISFNTRWGSFFRFAGTAFILGCGLFICAASFNETFNIVSVSQAHYVTAYSVSSLLLAIGGFILALGVIIGLVSLREFALYNKNGKKSVYVLQKGYGIKKEIYTVYYAHTKETMTLERKKFSLKRKWRLVDPGGELLAEIEEASVFKSILRKLFGHLWGMLRADYDVKGVLDSGGFILNHHTMFNEFTANIDKPHAIDALDMMVAALVINIRDRDSWHPSFN